MQILIFNENELFPMFASRWLPDAASGRLAKPKAKTKARTKTKAETKTEAKVYDKTKTEPEARTKTKTQTEISIQLTIGLMGFIHVIKCVWIQERLYSAFLGKKTNT